MRYTHRAGRGFPRQRASGPPENRRERRRRVGDGTKTLPPSTETRRRGRRSTRCRWRKSGGALDPRILCGVAEDGLADVNVWRSAWGRIHGRIQYPVARRVFVGHERRLLLDGILSVRLLSVLPCEGFHVLERRPSSGALYGLLPAARGIPRARRLARRAAPLGFLGRDFIGGAGRTAACAGNRRPSLTSSQEAQR
jgi:hypothetical protein